MVQPKLGFKALSLCALVIGIMAFVTSGIAQAEAGASWTYIDPSTGELKTFTKTLLPLGNAKLDSSTGSLLFTTGGGTKVAFVCTAGALVGEGGVKLLETGSTSEAQVKFTGCKTTLNGVESKPCEPHTGASKGEVITKKGVGLIKLHKLADGKNDAVVLITPTEKNAKGEPRGAIIELGELCAIGESVEVTGDLTVSDSQNEFSVHKVEHLAEEFPALRGLKALGQPAVVDGTALVFLEGVHKGLKIAALPG